MIEGLTGDYIKIIFFAKQESRRIGHSLVDTEQLLLGTIGVETSVAAKVQKKSNFCGFSANNT